MIWLFIEMRKYIIVKRRYEILNTRSQHAQSREYQYEKENYDDYIQSIPPAPSDTNVPISPLNPPNPPEPRPPGRTRESKKQKYSIENADYDSRYQAYDFQDSNIPRRRPSQHARRSSRSRTKARRGQYRSKPHHSYQEELHSDSYSREPEQYSESYDLFDKYDRHPPDTRRGSNGRRDIKDRPRPPRSSKHPRGERVSRDYREYGDITRRKKKSGYQNEVDWD